MADKVKIKDPVPGATAEEIIPTETEGTPILPSAKKTDPPPVNEFVQHAGEVRKKRIASGKELDPEVIKSNAADAPLSYGGIEKYHGDLSAHYYDAYEDYINPHTLKGRAYDIGELQQMRFENQTLGQEVGHAFARIGTNIIPQIIGGFSSMFDIPGYWDAEHAANNELVNWAASVKKKTDEEWFPIYTDPKGGKMDLDSSAWWFANGSGLVESVLAFAVQGAGAGKLVSWGLKGLGEVSRGKDLARYILGAGNAGKGAARSKTLLGTSQTLTTATMLNQAEAVIEASQVYRDIYERGIKANLSPEEAKRRAANAAATTMNVNRANILLNLTSAKAFLTPLKYSRNILKEKGFGTAVGELVKEGSQEAMEETINFIASKTGMAVGEGKHQRDNIIDDFKAAMTHVKDANSMEGLEAAFLGAIGGMGQTGITNALRSSKYGPGSTVDEEGNRISANAAEKIQYEKQQAVIQDMKEKGVRMTDTLMDVNDRILWVEKLNKANAEGNVEEVERLKNQMFEEQALKAFQTGTTEVLENLYEHEASLDPSRVGADYVARAQQAVKDLRELEAVYNNAEDFENVEEVFKNRASKIRIDRATTDLENIKKVADLELSKDVHTIAQKYKFKREQEVLFKKEGVVERTETRVTDVPLTYSVDNLDNNTGDTAENKATYDKFLAEVKSLESFNRANEYEQQLDKLKDTAINNSKEYTEITSKAYQEKVARQKENKVKSKEIAEQIQNATTISEVERLSRMSSDPAVKQSAKVKLDELKKTADAEAKAKKTSAIVQGYTSRIEKLADLDQLNKLREEIEQEELSQKNKNALNDLIETRIGLITGELTPEEAAKRTEDGESSLGGFDARSPEEIEAEIARNEKDVATTIPEDLPNPETEKESVEKEVTDTARKLLETDETKVIGEDEQGNLVYNYGRAENAYDQAAVLSREFSQTSEGGIVEREEITDEIENQQILDPDFLTPGTELIMEVDTEYNDDKYDATSDTRERIPWSTRLAQIKQKYGDDFMNSDEYINEVPIKVTTTDGNTVFYVHDNAWYREENLDNTPEGIAQNKAFNRQIREKIIKSKQVKTKVSSKSFGRLFKSADGKSISVSEAMPDDNLVMAVGRNGAPELGGDISVILGKGAKVLPTTIKEGRLYAIVRVGPNEYLPIPLEREPISEEVADSIIFAIEAHLTNDKDNPIVQTIIENNGLDILDFDDLRRYVAQFIYLYPTAKGKGLENILMSQGGTKSTLKSKRPLIAFTATGIEFGKPGVSTSRSAEGTQRYARIISRNFANTPKGRKENAEKLTALRTLLTSGNILSNAKRAPLSRAENVAIILNNKGESRTVKYADYLKESHKTNVRSINIGTESKPKWVYTIQPTITFDTSFAGINPDAKPKATTKTTPRPATRPKRTTTPTPAPTTAPTPEVDPKRAAVETKLRELAVALKEEEIQQVLDIPIEQIINEVKKRANNNPNTLVGSLVVYYALRLRAEMAAIRIPVGEKTKLVEVVKVIDKLTPSATPNVDPRIAEIEKRKEDRIKKVESKFWKNNEKAYLDFLDELGGYELKAFKNDQEIIDYLKQRIEAKANAELTALETTPTSNIETKKADLRKKIEYFDNTIEPEFEEGDYAKVLALAEKQVKDGTISQTPENVQLISNYPKLFEEFIKATDARNKTIEAFDKDAVLAGNPNKLPIYNIEVTVNENTKRLEIKWVEVGQEAITNIQLTKIGNYAASELISYKNKLEQELAALESTAETVVEEEVLTPTEEVENLVEETTIEEDAEVFSRSVSSVDEIEGVIEYVEAGLMSEEKAAEAGYITVSRALATLKLAKEIFIERAKNSKSVKLFGGKNKKIDGNSQDSAPTSEDAYDERIVPMTQEQVDAQRSEIDDMIIRGLSPEAQGSLIAYIASTIMAEALAATEKGGKKTVPTGPIFAEHLEVFKNMSAAYKEMGLKNNAAKIDAIIAQFDKVKKLVDQHMSLFTIGRVEENFNIDDNVEATGLEKVVYTDDWAFSVDYKATSSADLKKFFTNIQAQDENGPIDNILGWPEMLPYDVVTNTCHEILANKPADYELMMQILELHAPRIPWLRSVIDNLEKAPERIQNEFVSDMAKHHVDMQFVMWSKDSKGRYSLQRWSSNSSSIEQRIRKIWSSNLKGTERSSNLIVTNTDNEYVFNKEVAGRLIEQAVEFSMHTEDVTNDELAMWLGNFGIVITDETYKDLRKGKYNNQGKKSWNDLFNHSSGLIKVLSNALQKVIDNDISLGDSELLNDNAVKALAKLDANNTLNVYSNSFQAGGKTVYSYGNNNFLVNRMRDLTAYNPETGEFINQDLIDGLKKISFTRDSIWLEELTNKEVTGDATRRVLSVGYLSLEALKKKYSPSQDNRKLNNLTPAEHEVTKLGLFFNNSGQDINGELRRTVNFFYPTMSDKSTMLTIQALSRQVKLENGQISQGNIDLLIRAMVNCEIDRIRGQQSSNVKGYEPNYFYFIPSLNELMIEVNGTEKSFLDIVKDKNDLINSPEVKEALSEHIREFFNARVEEKLKDWKSLGIGETVKDAQGRVTDQFAFIDKEYLANAVKVAKDVDKVRYAAMDFVFNYLISNAEAYKLFAGDPALYAKFKSKKDLARSLKVTEESLTDEAALRLNLKETFTNMGKRLAGDIAPGLELANSVHNKYYQVFLEDQKMESANVSNSIQEEYFSKIIPDFKKNFSGIEGSDAQEYTTWKEHLYVMKQLGRLTKAQVAMLEKKLTAQSMGDFSAANELTYEELGLVLQPIKPVYVGNILDVKDNVDRRVYVKSSSFPLIPQLTRGMQIDKIRQGIEKFEAEVGTKIAADGNPAFVRASFNTANKVGAVANAVEVFDKDGNVVDDFNIKRENALLLSRANFRIQQDVPYKREKDVINIGVQERALLFGDLLGLEVSKGVTAEDLMELYNNNYQDIFEYNMEKLAEKLGLRETITSMPAIETLTTVPTTDIFSKVANFNEQLKGMSAVKKVGMQEIFAEEIGEDNLERANFINNNFDKIIKAFAESKINIFFDENQEFKNCD